MNKYPKRGEVFWVNLDPAIGTETNKTRPAVIVSNNDGNELSKRVIACPITSKASRVYPFEVKITLNGKPAKIMLNQCKALDKSRLQEMIGSVNVITMHDVDEAIRVVFGLN